MIRVAFDVDDTIWKVVRDLKGFKQVPDYDLIAVLRWFYNNGDKVYVWSAGGISYAQMVVDKLGLSEMVTVIPKGHDYDGQESGIMMDIVFDDMSVTLGKANVQVTRQPYEMDS